MKEELTVLHMQAKAHPAGRFTGTPQPVKHLLKWRSA